MGDADIRDVLDWNYYIERLGGTIQKIITIPAALQGLANPVPRVQHPDWLHKKMLEKNDVLKQRRINEMFTSRPKPKPLATEEDKLADMEDLAGKDGGEGAAGCPIVTKRKRIQLEEHDEEEAQPQATTWRQALGAPPPIGETRKTIVEWVRFQKKKWKWQQDQRQRNRQASKRTRGEDPPVVRATGSTATLGGFLRRAQRTLLTSRGRSYSWCPSTTWATSLCGP